MLVALANGASKIFPVNTIADALQLHREHPNALLAGEREGVRIRAAQTGSIDFNLGNSPREFTTDRVAAREIIMTTTNGTRALQACLGAQRILPGSVLNLAALARSLSSHQTTRLLIVCAGTFEEAAYEDTLAAGALCDLVWNEFGERTDSAAMAREIYLSGKSDLNAALQNSRNARRLLAQPELRDDVAFCWQRDILPVTAELRQGAVSLNLS
jgi:2-phosphosulfolactate phosphatase